MKTLHLFLTLTLFFVVILQVKAQKKENAEILMKNGDILRGEIEYVSNPDQVRLNTSCGNSYLLERSKISEIKKLEKQEIQRDKFYGNAQLGLNFSFSQDVPGGNFNLSGGYRLTDHLGIGLTAGIMALADASYPLGAEIFYEFSPRKLSKMSHFIRIQTGIPLYNKKISSSDIVYYDYIYPPYSNQEKTIKSQKTFFIHPEVGVKFNGLSNESFYLSVGYLFQKRKITYERTPNNYITNKSSYFNRMTLNLGYFF